MESGVVFNIERYATEDGHGIRTLVFLKGCALRCKWCANPESQLFKTEVVFSETLCTGCGKCLDICPNDAIHFDEDYGYISDSNICTGCGLCVDNCLYNARTLSGTEITSEELVKEILKDKDYFIMSGGGVTFSGGEPLFQSDFIRECSLLLKEHDIPVLIETCGYVPRENIENVLDVIDAIYFDLKHMNLDIHKELTGKDNRLILENLAYINDNFNKELSVRYPYIPPYNDDVENTDAAVEFIKKLDNVGELVFLPYHRLGLPKYRGLGRNYELGDKVSLKKNALYYLLERYKDEPIKIRIQ